MAARHGLGVLSMGMSGDFEAAIAAGGSSLRDHVRPDGGLGYFQHHWQVYGREGQPCPRCPGPPACAGVARIVQAGRSTFLCPRLQR
jgi:formamidopyrimidine-DNA glycosylase